MVFWKKKVKRDIAFPSETMLRNSIANNTYVYDLLCLIWVGFMAAYIYSKDIYMLNISILLSIFIVNYNISQKIDKARLQMVFIKDELDLQKGPKNGV